METRRKPRGPYTVVSTWRNGEVWQHIETFTRYRDAEADCRARNKHRYRDHGRYEILAAKDEADRVIRDAVADLPAEELS